LELEALAWVGVGIAASAAAWSAEDWELEALGFAHATSKVCCGADDVLLEHG
jgi:hypothetical protein